MRFLEVICNERSFFLNARYVRCLYVSEIYHSGHMVPCVCVEVHGDGQVYHQRYTTPEEAAKGLEEMLSELGEWDANRTAA